MAQASNIDICVFLAQFTRVENDSKEQPNIGKQGRYSCIIEEEREIGQQRSLHSFECWYHSNQPQMRRVNDRQSKNVDFIQLFQ